MGANKVFLIKLLNNFMEWIFIAIQVWGGSAPTPPPPPMSKSGGAQALPCYLKSGSEVENG